MKNVLWISKSVPYDKVPHAGGKTHNYYVKKIAGDKDVKITLVSMAKQREKELIDLEQYGIVNLLTFYPQKSIKWFLWRIIDCESVFNPLNRNGTLTRNYEEHSILSMLKKLKKTGYIPEVIILEWTQIILLIEKIKNLFPNIPVIGIETDVAYLGLQRKYKSARGILKKTFYRMTYNQLKKQELLAISKLDIVAVNNVKDARLLVSDDVHCKIIILTPYYERYFDIDRRETNNTIVFFGAMNREENWKSAIWFNENVMTRLQDLPVRFLIIGGNPVEELMKIDKDRTQVLGFVDDIASYFSEALCMVCPLLLGAGIKVKVLEGMSVGIPVLANDIAIEGIEAEDTKEYYYCSEPETYEKRIRALYLDKELRNDIGENGRRLIYNNFNTDNDVVKLKRIILSIGEGSIDQYTYEYSR